MEEIGPVDYAIIAFPEQQVPGEIAPAIGDLVDDANDPHHRHRVRREGQRAAAPPQWNCSISTRTCREGLAKLDIEVSGLFSAEDLSGAAEGLEPNSSAAL